jgi:ferritin
MLKPTIEEALNNQIRSEAESSQLYLAMAVWAETQGLEGTANFFYAHSDEERMHMLKLVKYVNERGGRAVITDLVQPQNEFANLKEVCQILLDHEIKVSESINNLVAICLDNRDYTTQNFLQWFVAEQIEEEALARTILDKLNLIGEDKGGLYLFDRDIAQLTVISAAQDQGGN